MARRRHVTPEIDTYALHKFERYAGLFEILLREISMGLKTFSPHWEAVDELQRQLRKAENIFNGRDPDYEEPHHAPFSRSVAGPLTPEHKTIELRLTPQNALHLEKMGMERGITDDQMAREIVAPAIADWLAKLQAKQRAATGPTYFDGREQP